MAAVSPPPIDARMVRTRAALRGALLSLIATQAFDTLTIRDIVAEAGVGYATFFRHFPSKAALLEEVAADELRGLIRMTLIAEEPADTAAAALALCTHVEAHRALYAALLIGGAAGMVREQFAKVAAELAPAITRRGGWLPVDLGILFGVGATTEILAWWLRQAEAVPAAHVASILDRLVVRPTIGPESGDGPL